MPARVRPYGKLPVVTSPRGSHVDAAPRTTSVPALTSAAVMSAPAAGAVAPGISLGASFGLSPAQMAQVAVTYGYVAFWIGTSAGVILYNKWILTVWGFEYPITLTMWHMVFCTCISAILVRVDTWRVCCLAALVISPFTPLAFERRCALVWCLAWT